ncbi:MAG TPA: M1 family metallopeptidase, partial [Gemmatimonadales bacterium]|nr:M1 family metallopeptidase [Gemmatimonadales bacterium]
QYPYWQQAVRYEIRASLDEGRGVLGGVERLVYHNHSPDTLTTISFHLYLNAFRPGSRWADADSMERRRRFNDLKDPDYGFNHVRNVRIMGQPVEAIWPFAPDSTVVRFRLPAPLAPGDSMVVDMDWDARPSTVPRRQGRRGRRFDFAQWYPKVVVYDRYGWEEQPLYPAGEFYGEFGTFLVDLDLPQDEVMGATGVPLCGDPGWDRANQVPDRPIQYQRDYYPDAPRYRPEGLDCVRTDGETAGVPAAPLGPGRKRVVWYAEQVHHFAMSLNPDYRYEGSAYGDVAIHVLYQPGDSVSWGRGVATGRTALALRWLDWFFGKFSWPQITNVHRIEGGGTEFPMMIMNGGASQGLIVHELGHNYVMGQLANNEWREGWLDEGFTSFQSSLFQEATRHGYDGYSRIEPYLTGLDLDGMSEPASLVSQDYRDFDSYNTSIYTRGEQFFYELRYLVGDETLLRIMRTYFAGWKLKHVDEAAFKSVAEEVSGMNLTTFFAEELHGTALVDYAVGRVKIRRTGGPAGGRTDGEAPKDSLGPASAHAAPTGRNEAADSGWRTRVEVIRKGDDHLPVEVWVFGQSDTTMVRTDGLAQRAWVEVDTRSKPREVRLDPRGRTRDWNMLNNVWRRGWLFNRREPRPEHYLDTWFSARRARDRKTVGWLPTVWYNDAAGFTLGLRTREDYFGRFDQNLAQFSVGTGWSSDRNVRDEDFFLRFRNPTWLRSPGLAETLEAYNVEGRFGASLAVEHTHRDHEYWGPVRAAGLSLTWLQPDDFRYLDPGYYEDAGTAELALSGGVADERGGWHLSARGSAAGGLAYNRRGLDRAHPGVDP